MATIIDVGNGSFIAGDPDTTLQHGNHWCEYCRGDGLDCDINDDLTVCGGCSGAGQVECDCGAEKQAPLHNLSSQ